MTIRTSKPVPAAKAYRFGLDYPMVFVVRAFRDGDGNPWFVADDVAEALAFTSTAEMTKHLRPGHVSKKTFQVDGAPIKAEVVDHNGLLITAVFHCRRPPVALAFKEWIINTVLPDLEKGQARPEAPAAAPEITVGDLNSTAPGSAARASAGKAPLDLVDLRVLADSLPRDSSERSQVVTVLELLGDYQMGGQPLALEAALGTVLALTTPEDVAAVLDYGRKKYAAWNWSKGFKWSVPLGCAARHLLAIHRGVHHDHESGLSHWSHVWCNLMMLGTFLRDYPDGNDFPWQVNAQVTE